MRLPFSALFLSLLVCLLLCVSLAHAHTASSAAAAAADGEAALSAAGGAGQGEVVVLTDSDFDDLVQPNTGENGVWIVEFYAPWCGHCKHLEPVWASLAQSFSSSPDVHVAKLDCTASSGVVTARRFDVRGFPTIKLFASGRVLEYRGPRTMDAFRQFVEQGAAKVRAGEGQAIPDQPAVASVALDKFLGVAGDVQSIVMKTPMAALLCVLAGLALGILVSVLTFTLCLERAPQEFVRFTDAATGEVRTVPYVRPSPTPSPALEAQEQQGQGRKKEQ